MLTVAAIYYTIDQNEPSDPFLLELDCPDNPTKEELEAALIKESLTQYEGYEPEPGETDDRERPTEVTTSNHGDLCVTLDGCNTDFLFVGLPTRLTELAKQFTAR